MKKAVMYGGGSIGRGFIGKVFSESGYRVCFLDIVPELILAFNERSEYRVRIVSNEGERTDIVKNVYAVNADSPQAAEEIAACDLMATAVGANILRLIAPNVAKGIRRRIALQKGPLDIILAENQMHADKLMRGWIYENLSAEEQKWAEDNLGLVEASIGRMVPRPAPAERPREPLAVAVEEYALLPVDRDAFKGEIPALEGLVPFSPFSFHVKRKLYIHNMGHALCAYFGWGAGCEYISEAAETAEIRDRARKAMMQVAAALSAEYGVPADEPEEYVNDLIRRFQNRALRDSVARVAADPIRKLRRDDRLVGAALYALDYGFEPEYIVKGIAAALAFDNPNDESAVTLRRDVAKSGIESVIQRYMGLRMDEPLTRMILKEYAAYTAVKAPPTAP